jgi:antitoxin YefM
MHTTGVVTAREAQQGLDHWIDRITDSHRPLTITGTHHDAVLIAAEDWRAIEETLYLHQFPGLVESIQQAAAEPDEEGTRLEDLDG